MLKVTDFYSQYQESLFLKWINENFDSDRIMQYPEVQRPGLALAGYTKGNIKRRILVFGKTELEYLKTLPIYLRKSRLKELLNEKTPMVIIGYPGQMNRDIKEICFALEIPVFISSLEAMDLVKQITMILAEAFSPLYSCHGTLVEAYGMGVLIQGDSSIGKSEAALGLIDRGHRLICDDVVQIKKKKEGVLEGTGSKLSRHLLEIRGIGIINVAHLYGAVCVREKANIDMVIQLEEWDDTHFYDRVGLEGNFCEILGIKVPSYVLPVKPGRDIVLLIETTTLNHRLKEMGYHSAKEFNLKLLDAISKRKTQEVHA